MKNMPRLLSRPLSHLPLLCLLALPVYGADLHPLIPLPREAHLSATSTSAASALVVVPGDDAEDNFAASDLAASMRERGIAIAPSVGKPALTITLLRKDTPAAQKALQANALSFEPAMQAEGYVVIARPGSATIIGDTASGVFYGVQTLKQLITGYGPQAVLATGTIRDWPAMKYRGIDDDLSRGPFPTLSFMEKQLRTFAAYKINIYSPYLEDNIVYEADPITAQQGGSLTRAQCRELARYAAEYHITIIPEQESFGHLHQILKYEKYSALAETPHGQVLAPGQAGTQPLIYSWFSQLAQDFPSPFLHIGADETFGLGAGQTKAAVQKQGLGPVYAGFLTQIHNPLEPLHKKLLFWGDIATSDPAAIPGIPKDMIAVPWIYWHLDSYDSNILPFKNAGIETWVAPGDSNWSVMYPLGANAIDNISGFVAAGQRLGSTGVLTTVWNDDGEGLFNEDWYGVLFGAAAGWQSGKSSGAPYTDDFGQIFYNDSTGKVMQAEQALINAANLFDVSDRVFWVDPWSKAGQAMAVKLRPNLHQTRLYVEQALDLLAQAQAENPHLRHPDAIAAMELGARRIDFAAMKFQLSDEMSDAYAQAYAQRAAKSHDARIAVRTLLESVAANDGRCADLRNGYSAIRSEYKQAWLAENRPYWLENVMVRYDLRIQLWQQREDKMDQVLEDWQQTHEMPTAAELGMPASLSAQPPSKPSQTRHKHHKHA
jgi:hexosaminidase